MSLLINQESNTFQKMEKLWKSIEEKNNPQRNSVSHANRKKSNGDSLEEILDKKTLQTESSRRDFLKLFGFTIASAAVAASCEQPVRKAIPYLIRPEEITPGKANYYASTYFDGQDYCSILVKVRDGRPIKIEGNTLSSVTKGGTSARVQASLLSLYDEARYKSPRINKTETTWELLDNEIVSALKNMTAANSEVILVTPGIVSPSTSKVIEEFIKAYPNVSHIQYNQASASGMLLANERSFGKHIIPSYAFDKAERIVSFGADFLGTWISPIEFAKQYAKTRSLTEGQKKLSRHIQFESNMSLTGSNADKRIPIKPSGEKVILANLYNEVAKSVGAALQACPASPVEVSSLADDLLRYKGSSLIISGSNDPEIQTIVNALNILLESYGRTIDLENPMLHLQGDDSEMVSFIEKLETEKIGGIIFFDVNPVYDYPEPEKLIRGMEKLEFTLAIASQINETADICKYVAADHHYLESWNDTEIKPGKYSLTQPAIYPLFDTRQAAESLLRWSGRTSSWHDHIKEHWQSDIIANSSGSDTFNFWNKCLHDGVFELPDRKTSIPANIPSNILADSFEKFDGQSDMPEIQLYEKTGIGRGRHANNPWLQELPDPVSKATWDNYINIAPVDAKAAGWKTGDLLTIDDKIELPVLIQPGQAPGTASVALGYGRTVSGKAGKNTGKNVAGLIRLVNGQRTYYMVPRKLERSGTGYQLAQTQTHHSMEGRAIIRNASLTDFLRNESAGNKMHAEIEKLHTTIYKKHNYPGHHWGMAIDLNKCIGCSACVVACTAENNIPVVGKSEVLRAHEMHWIRIDRYYEGEETNPKVHRQPVMCQHCDNAPCENVCPVAATNHSDEGINQMAYNRCIGTRYCNNNCPYKVRRFNWFDYTNADALKGNTYDAADMTLDLKRMVLNPDVTVRSKGVIEKCSFCIQRIQEKKLTAKLENRRLTDGEIIPACQQSCPADAIVFGDTNDPESKVSRFFADPRNYHLLEELHVLPSVGYLTKISNVEEA
jgi:molybdopterin-containing oxidoreductase family iron-sulfur binding subunit